MNNVFLGRATLQSKNAYGEKKFVFYNIGSGQKNSWRPTNGGVLKNPYKYGGKFFQGDLTEFALDGTVKVLKTFEVAEAVEATGTKIKIVRDDFRHQPQVGDVLMVAPSAATETGAAYAVTAVDETSDDFWTITIGTTLGALAKGDILVEGASEGTAATALVTSPNSFLDIDAVTKFPTNNAADNVIYSIAPVMHEIAYIDRMAPLPDYIKAFNVSRIKGLFEI